MRELIIAGREHISDIARLEAQTFSDPWSEKALELFFDSPTSFCAACTLDGHLASYCTVVTVLDEAQIINVATANEFKKQGCADSVIALVIDEAITRGLVSISLEVRESNVAAIRLYEKHGFCNMGKRRGFYKNPREDALVMIKNLS